MPYADPIKQKEAKRAWRERNVERERQRRRRERERRNMALGQKHNVECWVSPDVYERLQVEVAVRGSTLCGLVERLLGVIVDDELFNAVLDGE
jgi:hypothetical protein